VNSLILRTAARTLRPLLLLMSLVVLFRGHHEPGGGFAGGLLAAAAFSIRPIRRASEPGRRELPLDPHYLVGAGLLCALGSGLLSLLLGGPFMQGVWGAFLSTVLVFDVGVYLTVMGVVLLMIRTLAEE
jgi:multicomponent Na+:H+ antiporter subunit B